MILGALLSSWFAKVVEVINEKDPLMKATYHQLKQFKGAKRAIIAITRKVIFGFKEFF